MDVGHEAFDVGDALGEFGRVGFAEAHGGMVERAAETAAKNRGDWFDEWDLADECGVLGQGRTVLGLIGEAFEDVAACLEILEFLERGSLHALITGLHAGEAVELARLGLVEGIKRVDGSLEGVECDAGGGDFAAEHEFEVAAGGVALGELGSQVVDDCFGGECWFHDPSVRCGSRR
jgi:hypothetical protein